MTKVRDEPNSLSVSAQNLLQIDSQKSSALPSISTLSVKCGAPTVIFRPTLRDQLTQEFRIISQIMLFHFPSTLTYVLILFKTHV